MQPLRNTSLRARRRLLAPALLVIALVGPARASGDAQLDELVARALEHNLDIEARLMRADALAHETTRAGAWQNPTLSLAYQNVPIESFALDREGMSMVALRVAQPLPWFGKTERRRAVADYAARAARWSVEEERARVAAEVRRIYYRLALSRQLQSLTRDHLDLVDQLVDAVRIKYEVGRAPEQNLLRLELLRTRLGDDLHDFDAECRQLLAALNEILHRPPTTAVPTPDRLEVEPPAQAPHELADLAFAFRPALKELDALIAHHRAARDLARYEIRPDPTLFAQYGVRQALRSGGAGRDLVTVGLSLPLPVQFRGRNVAAAESAADRAREARARREGLRDAIASALEAAHARWQRSAQKAATYRQRLVPDAHRTLDATFASYQVGSADFLSLFEAELELLEFEKTIRSATVAALVARTDIEMIIGKRTS